MSLHAPEEHLQRGEEFGESAVYITLRVWCASKNCGSLILVCWSRKKGILLKRHFDSLLSVNLHIKAEKQPSADINPRTGVFIQFPKALNQEVLRFS